jgi:nucleotide-binding universal stress UspA family protein
MKTILVPTDFSSNAETALNYALGLAKLFQSEIILFNAWNLLHTKASMFITIKNILQEKAIEDLMETKQKILSDPQNWGIEIKTVTMMGDAAPLIKRLARKINADMIVMGTQGATGLKKIFMGSNTAEVIANAPCPVLAIPAKARFMSLKKIVFASNFGDEDISTLKNLSKIAGYFGSEIIVAHVADIDSPDYKKFESHSDILAGAIPYKPLVFKFFAGTNVVKGLNELVRSLKVDMLAMSTKKRNSIERVFEKSLTKDMAYIAEIPFLSFPVSNTDIKIDLNENEIKPFIEP